MWPASPSAHIVGHGVMYFLVAPSVMRAYHKPLVATVHLARRSDLNNTAVFSALSLSVNSASLTDVAPHHCQTTWHRHHPDFRRSYGYPASPLLNVPWGLDAECRRQKEGESRDESTLRCKDRPRPARLRDRLFRRSSIGLL